MNIAFLVGCRQYQHYQDFPDLPGVTKNIDQMNTLFIRRCGCLDTNVFRIVDENSALPKRSDAYQPRIGDIFDVLIRKEEEFNQKVDNLFFYFTGHGFVSKNGKVMLTVYDTQISQQGTQGALPLEAVHRNLEGFHARNVIYFLDMCLKSESGIVNAGDSLPSFPNSIVFYSCQLGETATMEAEGSVFTNRLVRAFQKPDALSVSALDRHLTFFASDSDSQHPHMVADDSLTDLDRIMITSARGSEDEVDFPVLHSEEDASRHIQKINEVIDELRQSSNHIEVFLKCIADDHLREELAADRNQVIRSYADVQSSLKDLRTEVRNMAARYYAYVQAVSQRYDSAQTHHREEPDYSVRTHRKEEPDYSYIRTLAETMGIRETGESLPDERMLENIHTFCEIMSLHKETINKDLNRMSELKRSMESSRKNAERLSKISDDFSHHFADGNKRNADLFRKMDERSVELRNAQETGGKDMELLDSALTLFNDVEHSLENYNKKRGDDVCTSLGICIPGFINYDYDYKKLLNTILEEMKRLHQSDQVVKTCSEKIRKDFGYTLTEQ